MPPPRRPERMTNEEIKARLILIVALGLTISFVVTILSLIYGLLFVTQPLEQAPNDASAWELLTPMVLFLTGALSGVLASNGLKDKPKGSDNALPDTSTETL